MALCFLLLRLRLFDHSEHVLHAGLRLTVAALLLLTLLLALGGLAHTLFVQSQRAFRRRRLAHAHEPTPATTDAAAHDATSAIAFRLSSSTLHQRRRRQSRAMSSGHPPLHPAAASLSGGALGHTNSSPSSASSQAQAEERMDLFMLGDCNGQQQQQVHVEHPQPQQSAPRTGLHPITTSGLGRPAGHVPSSPVSPMLQDAPMSSGNDSARVRIESVQQPAGATSVLMSTRAFLSAIQGSSTHGQALPPTGVPSAMQQQQQQQQAQLMSLHQEAEMMSQSEDELDDAAARQAARSASSAAAAASAPPPPSALLTAEELEQYRQQHAAAFRELQFPSGSGFPLEAGDEWLQTEELQDEPDEEGEEQEEGGTPAQGAEPAAAATPPPSTPGVPLTREEKLALEDKIKRRKKAAEMRYLVNSMYRCADCMQPPTDLELGFDEHAPPRRPAARPSAGPGSQYCCQGPALADALPPEFPLDLIPLTHSYLLSDAPSRSFLTTPPLPAQGTIQCYILKTSTRFELYLEMKNQPDFVAMRAAKEKRDKEKRERAEARARKAAGMAEGTAQMDGNAQQHQPQAEEKKEDAVAAAAEANTPSVVLATGTASAAPSPMLAPAAPPTLQHSHFMPNPMPILSLDDSEIGLRSPALGEGAAGLPLETPDVVSPTHCIDYEKLFPEYPPPPVTNKPARRNSTGATLAASSGAARRGQLPPPGALEAIQRQMASGRRMSDPGLFSLGPGLAASSLATNPSSGAGSPQQPPRRSLHPPPPRGAAPQGLSRRPLSKSGGIGAPSLSSSSSSLPKSASNLHLHQTRTNAVNKMLKEHAEGVITEGKDIFLLCAQRKRSWTGNAYILSSSREDIRADGPHFYGKLKSNFGGTEFIVTDNGARAPSKRYVEPLQQHTYPTYNAMHAAQQRQQAQPGGVAAWLASATSSSPPHVRHELAAVLYDHFFSHTGSPIRIKVLLPKRSFDLATEANVGGSIIKQYRSECERAEKLREAKEAREAAMAELKRVAEAKEAKENSGSRALGADADAQMADAEQVDPAAAAGAPAAGGAVPPAGAQQAQQAASSSSSASVAPLPELSGGADDPEQLQTTIETYENLRPVWHDGMNAYVLHFDHHRVREKSVKNFRIVRTVPDLTAKQPGATVQKTVLQFGRVLDRNVFIMDYAYPLSPLAAFAICLSSIDPKLAV